MSIVNYFLNFDSFLFLYLLLEAIYGLCEQASEARRPLCYPFLFKAQVIDVSIL